MSLSSDGTVMTMPVQPANSGGSNGFGWGGDGAWWIIILSSLFSADGVATGAAMAATAAARAPRWTAMC